MGSELVSKVVGASEALVSKAFRAARQAAPSVLFIDHIDALAPTRGRDASTQQTFDRILSVLLVEMDGIDSGATQGSVIVIGATSHREMLDPAILRPGRFDLHIHVPAPRSEADRAEVIEMHLRHTPICEEAGMSTREWCSRLAHVTQGLSRAELASVCREACMIALRENLDASCVAWRHFEAALAGIRGS